MSEVIETNKYWNEMIFRVCDGKASEMAALRKYDIFDFFDYIENKNKKHG